MYQNIGIKSSECKIYKHYAIMFKLVTKFNLFIVNSDI